MSQHATPEQTGGDRPWRQIHPTAPQLMDKLDRDRTYQELLDTIDQMAAPVTKANLEEALRYEEKRLGDNAEAASLLIGMRDMIDELVAETAENAENARRKSFKLALMRGRSARSIREVENFTLSCYTIDGVYDELAKIEP